MVNVVLDSMSEKGTVGFMTISNFRGPKKIANGVNKSQFFLRVHSNDTKGNYNGGRFQTKFSYFKY